jgi:hypothetical protein
VSREETVMIARKSALITFLTALLLLIGVRAALG